MIHGYLLICIVRIFPRVHDSRNDCELIGAEDDYTMEFITEIEKEIDRFHKEQADKQYAGNITGERL